VPVMVRSPLEHKGLAWGQDVFFLGYPSGDMWGSVAFIKKAIVSAEEGIEIFLDGHNNGGFSGGPIIYQDQTSGDMKIAGVITNYLIETILVEHTDHKILNANVGIVVGHSINEAVKLIRENGIIGLVVHAN